MAEEDPVNRIAIDLLGKYVDTMMQLQNHMDEFIHRLDELEKRLIVLEKRN